MVLIQRLGLTRYEADEYYRLALEAYTKKRDPDTAILHMNDAIALLPRNPEYYAARGLFQMEESNTEAARADFEQALKLHRYEMLAHYGLGLMAYRAGSWAEARSRFELAYQCDPKRPETLYCLALAYHRTAHHTGARAFMEQARAAFEAAGERGRAADAGRWLKEFQKILNATAARPGSERPELPGG